MPNIEDIILKKKKKGEFFNTYKPIGEIGKNVFDSFVKFYIPGKGFPLSQKDSRCGVLSNTMALSTLLELDSMGVDFTEFRDGFRFALKSVFDGVYKNGYRSNPIFDATPFLTADESDELDCYVETASKLLITMIDLRDFAHKNDVRGRDFAQPVVLAGQTISSFFELALIAEKLLIDATKFLNDSVLHVNEKEHRIRQIENKVIDRDQIPSAIQYRGWAFRHPNGEDDEYSTSIYYTYHATNAYISLYNTYSEILEKVFGEDNTFSNDESDIQKYSEEEKVLYKRSKDFIVSNKAVIDDFRIRTASSGRYIESVLSENDVDIALDYVKGDLTGIAFSDIIDTQDQNATINSLFVAAIFLNAGLDDDYEYIGKHDKVIKNIDWFFNQLQFAISNAKKIYKVLKVSNKQEIIDSFNLYSALLSEKYPSHQNNLVQKLRKGCRNVSVYDFVPLLCNTYMNIFEYMVKYPQIEMIDNLEMIMENCSKDGEWLWGDIDGFSINNNLYYIFALENFYEYYKNYEEKLSGNKKEYNRIVKEKEEEYERRLSEEKQKNEELEEEKRLLEEKRSDLDKEVEKLAEKKFDSLFEQRLTDSLDRMLTETALFYIDAFSESKTAAQSIEMFKNDKRLRVALALYSSIDFEKVAAGEGSDFVYLTKYDASGSLTKEYAMLMNKQINKSLAENVEETNKKGE